MTVEELAKAFNETFGISKWPQAFEVDHETYANVCRFILQSKLLNYEFFIPVAVGKHGGPLFKGVELLLK